jgi:integrase
VLVIRQIAETSSAPRAQLNTLMAALSSLYDAMGISNLTRYQTIQLFIKGVIKSGTIVPATKSKVMPVEPFRQLFYTLGDNSCMSLKDLRMKTISSLALTLMLRPSDLAPRSIHMDPVTGESKPIIFSTDMITFDDSMTIKFLGIKNDTSRSGFTVSLPPAQDKLLDPVDALQSYIERTEVIRKSLPNKPVFLSLSPPYHALSADGIAHVLCNAIVKANLGGLGFSAKSFRPTGATFAIRLGYDPEQVMRLGRWKTRSVFFDHYVHSRIPEGFTDAILNG